MKHYNVNQIIKCRVSGIEPYGIFVSVDKNFNGLIHISEVSNDFVRNVNDYVKVGEDIFCKIIAIDEKEHQMKLSIKDIDYVNTGKVRDTIDTSKGFKILKDNLPKWMDDKLNEINK